MDSIRQKFGSGAISFGSVLNNDIGLDTGSLPGSADPGESGAGDNTFALSKSIVPGDDNS